MKDESDTFFFALQERSFGGFEGFGGFGGGVQWCVGIKKREAKAVKVLEK